MFRNLLLVLVLFCLASAAADSTSVRLQKNIDVCKFKVDSLQGEEYMPSCQFYAAAGKLSTARADFLIQFVKENPEQAIVKDGAIMLYQKRALDYSLMCQ
jgi:hypothetical protein